MLLYLAVSNFKGIVLSELPLKSCGTFRDIVHEVLDSGSLPTEDTLVSYTAGECVASVAKQFAAFYAAFPEFMCDLRGIWC
jgi:hypothetical protein